MRPGVRILDSGLLLLRRASLTTASRRGQRLLPTPLSALKQLTRCWACARALVAGYPRLRRWKASLLGLGKSMSALQEEGLARRHQRNC